jgi:hypothetical protein
MTQPTRKKKLIEPRLQIRFFALFLSLALVSILVQAIIQSYLLTRLASQVPNDGLQILDQAPALLSTSLLLSFVLVVPLSLAIGIYSTFPIFGPLYRVRTYLTDVLAGKVHGPCTMRDRDELKDLLVIVNEVSERIREATPPAAADGDDRESGERRAA